MRADRLLSALLLLREHGRLSGRELSRRLGVSESTVHRDLEDLCSAGVPISPPRDSGGGWALDSEWQTRGPELEEEEFRALLMAQPRVFGDEQLAAAAGRALDKLKAALPVPVRDRAACIQQRLFVDTTDWRGAEENLAALPVIQDAVWLDRRLSFRYLKAGRELVERTVDPLGLVVKGNIWYLFARTPDGFRTYRVSRIDEARMLDQPAARPADFDLAASWKSSADRFRDEVQQAVEAYRRATAAKEEAERRTAQELEIARQVQARLFPQVSPPLSTLDYAGVCLQARPVGGDYYDFLDLGQDRLGLVIGDIAGKGIAAALLMANLQANVRSQCATASEHPERFLKSVNRLFHENTTDNSYASMFYAEYDDGTKRLRYVNCGHPSALLFRNASQIERLHSTSAVLGLFREWDCSMKETTLAPGDTLVLYTDGITESFDDRDEEFGEHRLIAAIDHHRDASSLDLLSSILEEVKRFAPQDQHDDITVIVVRRRTNQARL